MNERMNNLEERKNIFIKQGHKSQHQGQGTWKANPSNLSAFDTCHSVTTEERNQ